MNETPIYPRLLIRSRITWENELNPATKIFEIVEIASREEATIRIRDVIRRLKIIAFSSLHIFQAKSNSECLCSPWFIVPRPVPLANAIWFSSHFHFTPEQSPPTRLSAAARHKYLKILYLRTVILHGFYQTREERREPCISFGEICFTGRNKLSEGTISPFYILLYDIFRELRSTFAALAAVKPIKRPIKKEKQKPPH